MQNGKNGAVKLKQRGKLFEAVLRFSPRLFGWVAVSQTRCGAHWPGFKKCEVAEIAKKTRPELKNAEKSQHAILEKVSSGQAQRYPTCITVSSC